MDFDGGMHGILITAKNRDVLEFSFHCLLFRWDDINFVFLLLVGYWMDLRTLGYSLFFPFFWDKIGDNQLVLLLYFCLGTSGTDI